MTTFLITRPEMDAAFTAVRLRALSLNPVTFPLMARHVLDTPLPPAGDFSAMAVTSANALRSLRERDAIAQYRHLPIYTVGDQTAVEAENAGFTHIASAGGRLSDLAELLARVRLNAPIFYPSGKHLSGDLGKTLAPYGATVQTVPVYDMVAVEDIPDSLIARIESGGIDAVMLYSRRTAAIFIERIGARLSRDAHLKLAMLCLSEKVAEPLIDNHFARISLADRVDDEAMMSLALSFARENNA